MPHLATFFGVLFAIQMQMRTGQGHNLVPRRGLRFSTTLREPYFTQNIQHDGRTVLTRLGEWQTTQRANLQLELRDIAGVDGVVSAVVRAWRDFIHN